MGIFGAALLYGDGMITPAITVLGAVEGLKLATPLFDPYVVPIAVVILIGGVRDPAPRHSSRRTNVRSDHGGVVRRDCGARQLSRWCVNRSFSRQSIPATPSAFFREHGWHGFAVLGAVFLVVTGGEALYADMGHFGKRPIRFAWFTLVLPALLLNYFGQGALLLTNPAAAEQPFFLLAPAWALLPLVGPRDCRRHHRVTGPDFRRIFADATGHSAWLLPASRHRAHVSLRDGAGLRATGELGADGQHHCRS